MASCWGWISCVTDGQIAPRMGAEGLGHGGPPGGGGEICMAGMIELDAIDDKLQRDSPSSVLTLSKPDD